MDYNYMSAEAVNHDVSYLDEVKGSDVFRKAIAPSNKYGRTIFEMWRRVPWIVNFYVDGKEIEIRNWLNRSIGREYDEVLFPTGFWLRSPVTMRGRCWYGFATEQMLNRFLHIFPNKPEIKKARVVH